MRDENFRRHQEEVRKDKAKKFVQEGS